MELENRCALVTGGSRGIGRAIAVRLAADGAAVAVNYYPDPEGRNLREAEETAGLARARGARAAVFAADVADFAAVAAMAEAVARDFAPVDILVNNAAILADRTLRKMSETEWRSVIGVNLTGVFNCSRVFVEGMVARQWGRVISLASVSAQTGFWGQTNYAAAKAGVIGFTRSLARELAAREITVNAIAPGIVETEMARQIPEPVREEFLRQIPAGRFAAPEEIAELAAFLASGRAAYITGQTININGGWFMQ